MGAVGKNLFRDDATEIIGGKDVNITQFPHQVAIVFDEDELLCSGSILNEHFVLTAAHCVQNINIVTCKIRAGSTYYDKGGKMYDILSASVHPKRSDSVNHYDYDVAIIKSATIAIDGVTTKPVKLAEAGSSLKPGEFLDVTGWGRNANQSDSEILQFVSLPVVDSQLCQKYYKKLQKYNVTITERMVCAGYDIPAKSACHGDSGGPVLKESSQIQYGIVSFSSPNCSWYQVPNVYTYIPAVRDWIKEVTGV